MQEVAQSHVSRTVQRSIVVLVICGPIPIRAQAVIDNMRDRFGLVLEQALNVHAANFKQLPNVDNCCPVFESGSGSAMNLAIVYDLPLSRRWSLALCADYQRYDATLIASELADVYDPVQGGLGVASIEHRIATKSSGFGFTLGGQINPVAALRFQMGLRISTLGAIHFDQIEELTSSGFVFKENMARTRNAKSGEISNVNSLQEALTIGSSYEFALNRSRTWLLAPQFIVQLGLSSVAPDIEWHASSFRIGLALKFATPPMLPPEQLSPVQPRTSPNSKQQPNTSLSLLGSQPQPVPLDTLSEKPHYSKSAEDSSSKQHFALQAWQASTLPLRALDSIVIEENRGESIMPLLNYLFFEENSANIPERYRRIVATQTKGYRADDPRMVSTLDHYYDMLNIIGQRMRDHRNARIRLVGCNADRGAEKGATELSRRRAVALRSYLTEVWGIAPERLVVEARNLPQVPGRALGSTDAADEENRRVEVLSDDPRILEPLHVMDTVRRCTPDSVLITLKSLKSEASNSAQRSPQLIELITEDSQRRTIHLGDTTRSVVYALSHSFVASSNWLHLRARDDQRSSALQETKSLKSDEQSRTQDSNKQAFESGKNSAGFGRETETDLSQEQESTVMIPVHFRTLKQKALNADRDSTIDRIRLILFDYDRSDLSTLNRALIQHVQERINAGARVVVEGFSDELGDEAYNRRLSEERARRSASGIRAKDVQVSGRGESAEFPNSLPEGRFYNRSVCFTIIRPIVSP